MATLIMTNGIKLFVSFTAVVASALAMSAGTVDAETAKTLRAPATTKTDVRPDAKVETKPDVREAKSDIKEAGTEAKTDAKPTASSTSDATKPSVAGDDPLSPEAQVSVRKYCTNIAAAAGDARFAWQSKKLQELETKLKARLVELDAKQAELKRWYEKREAINKEAKDSLVGIYAKMKPENAAAQISALDDDMAVAVLAALSPGKASAIFNEITPTDRAAKLAGLLANPSAPPAEKKL